LVHTFILYSGYPTLSEWLSCLKDVTDWRNFAAHLLPSDSNVAEINKIERKYGGKVNDCMIELYGSYDRLGERTWTKIVEALEKSSHTNIAEEIRKEFCQ